MTWGEYFSDHMGDFLLHLATLAVSWAFLQATGTAPGVLLLLFVAWLLCFVAAHLAAFLKQRAYLQELETLFDGLDQKQLFAECALKPRGAYERHVFALLRRSGQAMVGQVSGARAAQRDYQEYIENWVHEVKAPITAAQLICRNAEPATRRKLQPELAQIENHVERALFYARAENPDRDFMIRKTNLAKLVAQAVERHRALLLQSGVRVETEGLDCTVYTDEKWAAFLLGQLLQNAVRYRTEAPVIHLSARALGQQVQLIVADNGIGIPAHELPRVFDRGFTGSNGRARGGATGMGLYLCRRLTAFLQMELTIRSTQGEGTNVTLTFPSQQNLSKL